MKIERTLRVGVWTVLVGLSSLAGGSTTLADDDRLRPTDVFDLEWASDPRVSPDGERVVYVRNSMDVMEDRRRSRLWIVGFDGAGHRPLTDGEGNETLPRWSPDGGRVLYVAETEGSTQLHVVWPEAGHRARLTQVPRSPESIAWSPDGQWISFVMHVPDEKKDFVELPKPPDGAQWADPPRTIDKLIYRFDGRGYLEPGYRQVFVLPAEGGTARRLTDGPFDHRGTPVWSPDGKTLVFAAHREEDWEYDPRDTDLYALTVTDGTIRRLTDRYGPDESPVLSPTGDRIAYVGFDDRHQGYQVTRLYVMASDGTGRRELAADLDRSVGDPQWSADGAGLYFSYSDRGRGRIGYVPAEGGEVETLASDLGGTSIGRPYSGGSFTVGPRKSFAYTRTDVHRPADVVVGLHGTGGTRRLIFLNRDLLAHKRLADVEELWVTSSAGGRRIQAWVARPPDFDPDGSYPLILEIHGGPFADYGRRWSAEVQLYAAAGYVVVYANPRGSSGYGEEFGNLIHHAYPGRDYDDLMSVVDAVVAKGGVDEDRLFVTGGSGGGVLTAWIVGRTDRFRAAVVAKPVINWYSFVLTADAYNFFYKYWFPGLPWDHAEHYLSRSPIALVGNVTTPTMLLTGENDYRTPISESEQFYQALKLRRVETALVRVPGASHGIARRPSHLMAKVLHVLGWFDRHGGAAEGAPEDSVSP